jgi:SAM-dependent methyltransferase
MTMRVLICSAAFAAACSSAPARPGAPAAAPTESHNHGGHHAGHAGAGHHHGDGHGGMVHRFEKADDWAKVFDDPARDAWQKPDDVIAALQLGPSMYVADIGAGTGYFTMRLARAAHDVKVTATDIEPDMVRYINERAAREQLPNVLAMQSAANDPKLPADSFDRVLVVDVWHHISDRVAYAKGLAAALKPGGMIAIVDFTMEAKHGPPQKHRLLPEAIIGDLKAAGLSASISPTKLPDQYIVVGKK